VAEGDGKLPVRVLQWDPTETMLTYGIPKVHNFACRLLSWPQQGRLERRPGMAGPVTSRPLGVLEVEQNLSTAVPKKDEDEVRVLFVEDDPAVAQMYRLKLELDGYLVEIATDGEQAVARAISDPPDIVFLDIRLPKLDGLGVLEALRNDNRTRLLPVVILSNYSERELIDRGLKLGALEYLIKSQTTPAKVAGGVEGWLKG
jgi:CheY-like chemotaxis protein